MPARIVTYVHRPKRPPRKRKAVAITGPAIVRKVKASRPPAAGQQKPEPVGRNPANLPTYPPAPVARKPAIVTTTSRKGTKPRRPEERATEPDDPEAVAMRAWLERAKWGHGPAR